MTIQEKKQYLQQYRNLDDSVTELFEEIKRLRTIGEKIAPASSLSKENAAQKGETAAAVQISRLEEKMNREIERLVALGESIQKSIDQVPDVTLRLLLKYKYIHGMTWEEVSEKMGYTYRWVLRLHKKALRELAIESHISSVI